MVKLDETKVLLVVIFKDEAERQQCVNVISRSQLVMLPMVNKIEVVMLPRNANLAAACNIVVKNTNARYRLFLTVPVVFLNPFLIASVLEKFLTYPNIGMIGLIGSEIPISGDYKQAKNLYGRYYFSQDGKNVNVYFGKEPLYYQSVHMLDEGFFATSGNILFDEEIGEDFVMAAQCCLYRRAGYEIDVMSVENVGVAFKEDRCLYSRKNDPESYKKQLGVFKEKYKDIVTPLVSICIPTYNQQLFLEFALQSALTQTYNRRRQH